MTRFRPATIEDHAAVSEMVRRADDLRYSFANHPGGPPLDRAYFHGLIEGRISPTIVLGSNGPVGFGALYGLKPGKRVSMGYITVHPDARGAGHGRALVQHLTDVAFHDLRLPELRLFVEAGNMPALLLYNSCGFQPYEVTENINQTGNRSALLRMRKMNPDAADSV